MVMNIDIFSEVLSSLGVARDRRLAVAVSGGGDSMALAMLLEKAGHDFVALTVDHGLRDGSAAEARQTAAFFAARNIPHRLLVWEGDKPETNLQERARDKRYELLTAACHAEGCGILALGHNLEDQAETFWMRLAHGSGLDGLAGMASARDVAGIRIIRPLLGFPRAELRDFCRAEGVPYADDPSNENEKFLRVRLRKVEDVLAAEGMTPVRLSQTMEKLHDARQALEWLAAEALAASAVFEDARATIDVVVWSRYPLDIRRRVVVRTMQRLAPRKYPPESEALARLCADLARADFRGRTLGGLVFAPAGGTKVSISPEKSA